MKSEIKWCLFQLVLLLSGFFTTDFIVTKYTETPFCPLSDGQLSCDVFQRSFAIDEQVKSVQQSYYRNYPYETLKTSEQATTRWQYFTSKQLYEMINQDPKIGLNGMWRREIEEANKFAVSVLKEKTGSSSMKAVDLFRQQDSYNGVRYLVNYLVDGTPGPGRYVTLELLRKYTIGKPHLKSVEVGTLNKPINIIVSLSKVSERFTSFLERYEDSILAPHVDHSQVRITFIVASVKDQPLGDALETRKVIDAFKRRNKNARITNRLSSRDFYNKGADLHDGILQTSSDEIILIVDVDMLITEEFLSRVRMNTVKGKRVFFPVSFSQYDPEIMEEASRSYPALWPLVKNKLQLNKETGFWMHYAYGIVGMYKEDYLNIGGYKLDIKGWGVEDVDLYKRFVTSPLEIMSVVDRDLQHIYHKRTCDVKLESVQYQRCIGAWAEMLASQLQTGLLYEALQSH